MALGFTANRANIKPSAISSWYLKSIGTKYKFTCDYTGVQVNTATTGIFANTYTVQVKAGTGGTLPTGMDADVTYYVINYGSGGFALSLTSGGSPISVSDDGTGDLYVFLADKAYYDLKQLYEGKLEVKSLSTKQSLGQNVAFGAELSASAKIFATGKTNVLKVLDSIGGKENRHVINLISGSSINSAGLVADDDHIGTKWKFVCDADSDKNRYIEISASRKLSTSQVTELLTTAAPTYGTGIAADTLYPLASVTRADIIPAGFKSFTVCDTYNGSFLDIGKIMNGKFTAELLTQADSRGAEIGYAIKLDVEVQAMQASATELALLENLSGSDVFYKITLLDGTVITLGSSAGTQVGIDWDFVVEKDSDGVAYIKYTGTGIILGTALDAVFV